MLAVDGGFVCARPYVDFHISRVEVCNLDILRAFECRIHFGRTRMHEVRQRQYLTPYRENIGSKRIGNIRRKFVVVVVYVFIENKRRGAVLSAHKVVEVVVSIARTASADVTYAQRRDVTRKQVAVVDLTDEFRFYRHIVLVSPFDAQFGFFDHELGRFRPCGGRFAFKVKTSVVKVDPEVISADVYGSRGNRAVFVRIERNRHFTALEPGNLIFGNGNSFMRYGLSFADIGRSYRIGKIYGGRKLCYRLI